MGFGLLGRGRQQRPSGRGGVAAESASSPIDTARLSATAAVADGHESQPTNASDGAQAVLPAIVPVAVASSEEARDGKAAAAGSVEEEVVVDRGLSRRSSSSSTARMKDEDEEACKEEPGAAAVDGPRPPPPAPATGSSSNNNSHVASRPFKSRSLPAVLRSAYSGGKEGKTVGWCLVKPIMQFNGIPIHTRNNRLAAAVVAWRAKRRRPSGGRGAEGGGGPRAQEPAILCSASNVHPRKPTDERAVVCEQF